MIEAPVRHVLAFARSTEESRHYGCLPQGFVWAIASVNLPELGACYQRLPRKTVRRGPPSFTPLALAVSSSPIRCPFASVRDLLNVKPSPPPLTAPFMMVNAGADIERTSLGHIRD